jgi:hypothetical protein
MLHKGGFVMFRMVQEFLNIEYFFPKQSKLKKWRKSVCIPCIVRKSLMSEWDLLEVISLFLSSTMLHSTNDYEMKKNWVDFVKIKFLLDEN